MGTTVIGPTAASFPVKVTPPIIELKYGWNSDWLVWPELILDRCSLSASAHDLSSAQFHLPYGSTKYPWESGRSTRGPVDLTGYWVRVRLVGPQGWQTIWMGQISGQAQDVHGSAGTPSGVQVWTAYGPEQILRKIAVSRSHWSVGGVEKNLGWLPAMNDRDGRSTFVGNRSAAKIGDPPKFTYTYGGTSVWTHEDYLDYLLSRFVDDRAQNGPRWWFGGQTDLLAEMSETIRFGREETVASILGKLISPSLGIDYRVVSHDGNPNDSADYGGFEIHVHALVAEEYSFAGATLPRNPNLVRVYSSQTVDNLHTRIVRSTEQSYGRIRLVGERIVVCCSLWGDDAPGIPNLGGPLHAKWDFMVETAYKAGTGEAGDSAEDHDDARQQPEYETVYARFGAPGDPPWNFNWGSAAPLLTTAGELEPFNPATNETIAATTADYQTTVRETLTWLPMHEGVDYSVDPPVDSNPAGYEAELLRLMAWVYDREKKKYIPVEAAGISLSVPRFDWGIVLTASPAHLLAYNFWAGANPTNTDPKYDYNQCVCTIAFRSDQRFEVVYQVGPALNPPHIEGELVIPVPGAEFWYLAPLTALSLPDADAHPFEVDRLSGPSPRVLRTDAARMAAIMAGAIARYHAERARAEVQIASLVPWGGLLGQILSVIEESGTTQTIQAVITEVSWEAGEDSAPSTTIRTGYARSR